MANLLANSELRSVVADGLEDADLSAVIAREEAWLAGRIGQLSGSRTQTMRPPSRSTVLLLQRPTGSVTVKEDGSTLATSAYRLLGDARLERAIGSWGIEVAVTYTPTDVAAVKRALIELVRGTLSASPNSSESAGGHSVVRAPSLEEWRGQVVRSLEPHRGPFTLSVTR